MIPLVVFLLGCAALYLGSIGSAFSVLMRLPLRLVAERSDRSATLGRYLDDPIQLFAPVRLLLGLVTVSVTALLALTIGINGLPKVLLVIASAGAFVAGFELLLPMAIVGRNPERVLELLLPSFAPIARVLAPVTDWTTRRNGNRRPATPSAPDEAAEDTHESAGAYRDQESEERLIAGEERKLLQSIVNFRDRLVREVMTPRPDIVAIREDASMGDLIALFREQEYSRFPVYKDSLDNIAGFVFVKDILALESRDDQQPIVPLLRPAAIVPESKRVPELLRQFQRQQTQTAIVVDEYGGTAGLVTLEDMLEEIVGEIRDEYDVESEPVVDEGGGQFVFHGKLDIDEVARRLNVEIARDGFETVGGFILSHLGRVPTIGEHLDIESLHVEVLDVERRRVNKVRITVRPSDGAGEANQPA